MIKPQVGRECPIICKTTDRTESVSFFKESIRKGYCIPVPEHGSICQSLSDRYDIKQRHDTGETILHIKNVSRVYDSGKWRCTVGRMDKESKQLQIFGKPFNVFSILQRQTMFTKELFSDENK